MLLQVSVTLLVRSSFRTSFKSFLWQSTFRFLLFFVFHFLFRSLSRRRFVQTGSHSRWQSLFFWPVFRFTLKLRPPDVIVTWKNTVASAFYYTSKAQGWLICHPSGSLSVECWRRMVRLPHQSDTRTNCQVYELKIAFLSLFVLLFCSFSAASTPSFASKYV